MSALGCSKGAALASAGGDYRFSKGLAAEVGFGQGGLRKWNSRGWREAESPGALDGPARAGIQGPRSVAAVRGPHLPSASFLNAQLILFN